MPNWLKSVLKMLPLQYILEYLIAALKEEVKKTENTFDDMALVIVESVLKETGLLK